MGKDVERDQATFARLARSPELWLRSAEMLKKSADVLLAGLERELQEHDARLKLLLEWGLHRQGQNRISA